MFTHHRWILPSSLLALLLIAACTSEYSSAERNEAERLERSLPQATVAGTGPYEGMRLLPAGTFLMGRQGGLFGAFAEEPVHSVSLDAFYLDETEVAQEAYERNTGRNQSFEKHPRNPVTPLSWLEAEAYCKQLGKRLPTEAEWEYAARAGGSWRTIFIGSYIHLHDYGNYGELSRERRGSSLLSPFETPKDLYEFVAPVRTYKPNGWGLYEMYGNAAEWVSDWYAPYTAGEARNPSGPETGTAKVVRGGSYFDPPGRVTPFYRDHLDPATTGKPVGVRCAADAG